MYIGIIAKLAYEKKELSAKIEKIDRTIVLLRELDGPSELSDPVVKKRDKPEKKNVRGPYKKRGITSRKAAERIAGKAVKHIAGHHGPLKKVSQHKGVSLCKKRKNGTQKWRVQYYDPSTRRIKSLGAYYSEIEAAAVYQDHIGNEVEAARLRALDKQQTADMAEQKENNPDRVKADKMVMVWVCSHCRIEWKSKPDSCPNCNSASFKPKKVDADSI